MRSAFLFLLTRSLKNRVSARVKRLRNPKYLFSALAGFAYLYFAFLHPSLMRRPRMPRTALTPDPGTQGLVELLFAGILAAAVILQFFFTNARTPLFNGAEVQFLFPAPVSRGALLNYRLAKSQTGIFFGSLISLLVFGRGRMFPNTIFPLITIWAVYSFLFLYRIAVLMGKENDAQQGHPGRDIRRWVSAWILLAVVFLIASARWFYPSPPMLSQLTAENLIGWLKIVTASGPVYYVLLPFRLFVRPAFAVHPSNFLLGLVPVLAASAALYAGIRRSNTGFETSVLGKSGIEEIAGPLPGSTAHRRKIGKPRRPPFHLEPDGFAPIGIYWKNLSLAGGLSMRRALPGLVALAILSILLARVAGEQVPLVIGSACAAMAGFLTLMGPILFRDDLRTDLQHIDLLKTYPVTGWGIVLGEVLGPATVLAILQLALVVLAAGMLPSIEDHPWTASQRIYVGVGAALLLPCLSFIGILVQNAAVLLLPGWIPIGSEHPRGVEAMGQRLISSLATILSLLIAAVPAALLFLVTGFAGYRFIGLAIVPVASFVAAVGLLVEGAIGIFWLGLLFDKFDPSDSIPNS
jgi:ABC-2 type transport system permease protein